MTYIVIDYDPDPDLSWLMQDCFAGEDPDNHVTLEMIAFNEDGEVTDCLCGIDFFKDGDNWATGTFYKLSQLSKYSYLQEIARQMGLPE